MNEIKLVEKNNETGFFTWIFMIIGIMVTAPISIPYLLYIYTLEWYKNKISKEELVEILNKSIENLDISKHITGESLEEEVMKECISGLTGNMKNVNILFIKNSIQYKNKIFKTREINKYFRKYMQSLTELLADDSKDLLELCADDNLKYIEMREIEKVFEKYLKDSE